jgi:hypothetical protein
VDRSNSVGDLAACVVFCMEMYSTDLSITTVLLGVEKHHVFDVDIVQ